MEGDKESTITHSSQIPFPPPPFIPKFVYPVLPGIVHPFYGSAHLKSYPDLESMASSTLSSLVLPTQTPQEQQDTRNQQFLIAVRNGDADKVLEIINTVIKENQQQEPIGDTIENTTVATTLSSSSMTEKGNSLYQLINSPSPLTGLIPLHVAANKNHVDVMKVLIAKGSVTIDAQDHEGEVSFFSFVLAL